MNRLVAPDVPPSAHPPAPAEFPIPPDGLGRNEVLTRWHDAMDHPMPATKELVQELKSWSGTVGKRPWAAERYGATTAMLMRSPALKSPRAADWAGFHSACAEAIEPLSRYTAGWSGSFEAIHPDGLHQPFSNQFREQARKVGRKLRPTMCNAPSVIDSTDTVAAFVADPTSRHARDLDAAVNVYCIEVRDFLDRLAPTSAADTAAEAVIIDHLDALLAEFDVDLPDPPTEAERAAAEATARKFLDPIGEEFTRKHAHRPATDYRRKYFSAAYLSLLTTYTRRLLKGLPLAGTEHYLGLRVRSEKINDLRRLDKEKLQSDAGERVASAPSAEAFDDVDADDAVTRLKHDAVRLIAADPTLRTPDRKPYWEARTAIEVLLGRIAADITDQGGCKRLIAARWEALAPSNSRSSTAAGAAQDVWLLITTALRRALDDPQDPS